MILIQTFFVIFWCKPKHAFLVGHWITHLGGIYTWCKCLTLLRDFPWTIMLGLVSYQWPLWNVNCLFPIFCSNLGYTFGDDTTVFCCFDPSPFCIWKKCEASFLVEPLLWLQWVSCCVLGSGPGQRRFCRWNWLKPLHFRIATQKSILWVLPVCTCKIWNGLYPVPCHWHLWHFIDICVGLFSAVVGYMYVPYHPVSRG